MFQNAVNTDEIIIGSTVSTTSFRGQAINIKGPTIITGMLTTSTINMYGGYIGMKPINGNYLQFFTSAGFTFNCNTGAGFTGYNETMRIGNTSIVLNQPTTINGTLTSNSVAISTTGGLTTPIVNFSDYNGASAYTGAIFQQSNNMTI